MYKDFIYSVLYKIFMGFIFAFLAHYTSTLILAPLLLVKL